MADTNNAVVATTEQALPELKKYGPRFSPEQREVLLARVAELYLESTGMTAIARDIGVSPAMALKYVRVLEKRWRTSAMRDFDAAKAVELAKLDHLEQRYWEAWDRSCLDATETQTVIVPDYGENGKEIPKRKRQTIKKSENVGDPRFLDGVFKCIDRRIKLLGVDAAERHTIEARGGAQNALDQRLEQYGILFGATIVGGPPRHPDRNDPDEPVDTERSAPEASGILDARFELR